MATAVSPGKATVVWHGNAVSKEMREKLYLGLKAAAEYGKTEIVKAISRPSRIGAGGRRRPGRGRSKGRPQQFNRSKPGQPPKRDTGKLAQSIFSSSSRSMLMATVGTTKKYGVSLELGATVPMRTPKRKRMLVFGVGDQWVFARKAAGFHLAARPYVLKTLKNHKQRIESIIFSRAKQMFGKGGVSIG